MIYYDVPVEHSEKELPSIAPPGEAGRPGEGSKPEQIPNLGSAVSLGDLTVISKPSQPDNHHQTIIQPLSPPEMRITQDVKLPNVILGNLSAPRAPLTFAAVGHAQTRAGGPPSRGGTRSQSNRSSAQ